MHTVRLLLMAVMLAISLSGCSRGPQGDPEDAAPVRALIERLDAEAARLQQLFELRMEVEQARVQLASLQRELSEDFPQISTVGGIEDADLPPSARGGVRAFRASVREYDHLVARHNALAEDLRKYLEGRSPAEVRRLLEALRDLRAKLAHLLEQANYTKAVYVARHAELVKALDLNKPEER